jgi:hypothetical protein
MYIPIDWSHYMRRNENKMRNYSICQNITMVEISMNTIYVMKSKPDDVVRISTADNNVGRIGLGGKRKTKKYKKTVGKRRLNARRKTRRYKKSRK